MLSANLILLCHVREQIQRSQRLGCDISGGPLSPYHTVTLNFKQKLKGITPKCTCTKLKKGKTAPTPCKTVGASLGLGSLSDTFRAAGNASWHGHLSPRCGAGAHLGAVASGRGESKLGYVPRVKKKKKKNRTREH